MALGDGEVSELVQQEWVSRLRVLDLGGNKRTELGCRALCASKHLDELKRLDLTNNMYSTREPPGFGPNGPAIRRLLKERFGKRVVLFSR
jgi:hypothetical protein